MNVKKQFRAAPDLKLDDRDAGATPLLSGDKEADAQRLNDLALEIAQLQDVFYAEHRRKLLVILQGMDTSGKDGTVKGVFGRIDPLGIRTVAFKAPGTLEKEHDYLWRIHREVPGQGEIVIFNRSHYEDVLITRVHEWIDADEVKRRYAQIRDFERMLVETGTTVLKFFLHISKDEQKERLEKRLENPDKHWKFDPVDLQERRFWDSYQQLYEKAIRETNTDAAPWYVIPADSKPHRNLAIAAIVLDTLQDMKLAYPPGDPELATVRVE
ncbi:polyphosphate kinase 2 family protein [Oxalobacteraceae bacterium OM1]|nr:polyphosphate kinase 2 family protein [Oxalobacteraceae bacterium OM1]